MSSFDADALANDTCGLAFLAETIDAERRSDDAFRKAFDPSRRRTDIVRTASWIMDARRAALVLAGENA